MSEVERLTVLLFQSGRQSLSIRSAERDDLRRVRAGIALAVPRGATVHAADGMLHPVAFWSFSLHPDEPSAASWPRVNGELRDMLDAVSGRAFGTSDALVDAVEELDRLPQVPSQLLPLAEQNQGQRILLQLLRDAHVPHAQPAKSNQRTVLLHCCRLLNQTLDDPLPWPKVAREVGASPERLWTAFRRWAGCSPLEFANARRVRRAERLLRGRRLTNTQVAHAVGFSTSQYFAVVFRRLRGLSPSEYRRIAKSAVFAE